MDSLKEALLRRMKHPQSIGPEHEMLEDQLEAEYGGSEGSQPDEEMSDMAPMPMSHQVAFDGNSEVPTDQGSSVSVKAMLEAMGDGGRGRDENSFLEKVRNRQKR